MARNKYPEETINLILDVAGRLFIEKGYEHTSIQDIINNLGGLSKGAIYHHFKSKEDILVASMERMTENSNLELKAIRERSDICGKEKLKTIFKESLLRSVQKDIFATAPSFTNNPQLLFLSIQDTLEETVPQYILPIIKEGIADGSIQTQYPEELSELIILVANFWLNPMVFNSTPDKQYRKIMIYSQMMAGLGLNILDNEIMVRLQELTQTYHEHK